MSRPVFLKELSLFGFKSFADKIVLHFGPGITAIVGPNGSGKTNVVEALTWAMGESNVRCIRGNRADDVIFSGSARRKPLGMAEVSVSFDNLDGALPVEFSEVSVTRRIYRSGEGEFLLNGASCRLRDIHELFLDIGVSRESLAILDRSRLDWVLSANPVERRLAIEGVAGVLRHKTRRKGALKKLEDIDQQLLRLGDLVAEVANTLGPIEHEARKAELYGEYERELFQLELSVLVEDLVENRRSLAKLNDESLRLDQRKRATEEELAQLEDRVGVLLEGIGLTENDINLTQGELVRTAERYQKVRGEIDLLEERLRAANERLRLLEEEREKLAAMRSELEETRSDEENAARLDQLGLLQERIAVNETERDRIRHRISVKRRASERLKGDLIEILNLEARTRYQLQALTTSKAVLGDDSAEAEELRNVEARLKSLSERASALSYRLGSLRSSELIPHEGPRLILQRCRSGLREELTDGIVGVVIDLIEIPDEYLVAIEVALGPAATNVVTVSEKDARVAIDYLKRVDGGRATFLPLDTLRPRSMDEEERKRALALGAIDVASRLVRCDSNLTKVVEYLLGRTVVARDINKAVEVARGFGFRVRCVSLGGDVVHAGGAITGGSHRRPASGVFGGKKRISQLEAELSSLRSTIRELEQKRELIVKARVEAQTRALEDLKSRAERIREGIGRLEEQLRADVERERSLEDETTSLKVQLASHRADYEARAKDGSRRECDIGSYLDLIRAKSEELERLERESGLLRETISSKVVELGEVEARKVELETKLGVLQRRKSENTGEISRVERRLKSLRRSVSDLQANIHQLELEKEKIESSRFRIEEEVRDRAKTLWGIDRPDPNVVRSRIPADIQQEDRDKRVRRMEELREKMNVLGDVHPGSIDELRRVRARYEFLKKEQLDLEQARKAVLKMIGEIDTEIGRLFTETFERVNRHFGEIFGLLFGGGTAELCLVEAGEEDGEAGTVDKGVEIQAQPPGKKIKGLNMLSGGERALTGIAFLLSLLRVRRIPFCVLDEVDAPLDEANARRFASLLRSYSNGTQLIIITHQREIMEVADVLYGVTMAEEGVSQVVSVQLEEKVG